MDDKGAPATRPLEGRVAIITGSSRGIGRALALRLSKDGAKVVITGKSEQGNEVLPGSIHTVASEIRAQGGVAVPIRLDVRDDAQIAAMVERTIAELGRIDVLINNAGVLWWERVVDTPPKRADLILQINTRATYLCSYHCLPHMVRNGWGHIISCSPPISTQAHPGYAVYMASKMGMTRIALGIAEEHRADNVAANSLWPAAPIESFATRNWDSAKMGDPHQWRTPDILCDAAMQVLSTAPRELTGRQLIDEELLRERGWTDADIDRYWLEGTPPEEPMWIDGREGAAI